MAQHAGGQKIPGDILTSNDLGLCTADRAFVAAFKGGEDNGWQTCARYMRARMGAAKPKGGMRPPLSAREVVQWALGVAREAPAAPGTGLTRGVRSTGPVYFMTTQVGASTPTALSLHLHCTHTALSLHSHCTLAALPRHTHCTFTALWRHSHCTHSAVSLHSDCTLTALRHHSGCTVTAL
jgi:hypothetical protein